MKQVALIFTLLFCVHFLGAQTIHHHPHFEPLDVFQLENVSDPQISPDGERIIFARTFRDIMTDRTLSNLWICDFDGSQMRPLTTGNQNDSSPRWSPDGKQIVYRSNRDGSNQIYLRWLDTGAESKLTNLTQSPSTPVWSRDGKWLTFTMFVPKAGQSFAKIPSAPKGAKWAEPAKYIDKMKYRSDGGGYIKDGFRQIFILSTDGGTPRQITYSNFNCNSPTWSADGASIIFSSNQSPDRETNPNNTEVHEVILANGNVRALTAWDGPNNNPIVSPDGKSIAYTGFAETYNGYQITNLYVIPREGMGADAAPKNLTENFDRQVSSPKWAGDGKGIYFQYNDKGNTKIAHVNLDGKVTDLVDKVGGLSLGRPYSGGAFSVSKNGNFAFTHGDNDHPADLAVGRTGQESVNRLTHLNDDLFKYIKLGEVEELWTKSSHDGRDIQSWICKPPDFDPSKKYPLILEIHGGPFAMYGDWFSAEVQMYAAAGYVVVYANPRGSSGYGEEFGQLIHHNYPSQDYDDLMSTVDAVIGKGYVDEEQLFVTGGSGGGVLTAWIVGHTDRFRAAVVAKPVINWYSFVLTADNPAFFYKYWFPGLPWDNLEHYMKRSPLSYAGNVTTPTMLLTGEVDYRTPMSETEQFYTALKLANVETAMVRFPQASHGIASRPSYLMSKVLHILEWFEKYRK